MRIIKFRCKRIDTGKWVYGMPYSFTKLVCDIPIYDKPSILMFNPKWDLEAQINYLKDPVAFSHLKDSIWKVIPESVGQYIGLNDLTGWKQLTEMEQDKWICSGRHKKNWKGKVIYTGDIIRYLGHEVGYVEGKGSVQLRPARFKLVTNDIKTLYQISNIVYPSGMAVGRVVGNLTDNPELIKREKI